MSDCIAWNFCRSACDCCTSAAKPCSGSSALCIICCACVGSVDGNSSHTACCWGSPPPGDEPATEPSAPGGDMLASKPSRCCSRSDGALCDWMSPWIFVSASLCAAAAFCATACDAIIACWASCSGDGPCDCFEEGVGGIYVAAAHTRAAAYVAPDRFAGAPPGTVNPAPTVSAVILN